MVAHQKMTSGQTEKKTCVLIAQQTRNKMDIDKTIDRTHILGQLNVVIETIIYLQEQQIKLQKQLDELKK